MAGNIVVDDELLVENFDVIVVEQIDVVDVAGADDDGISLEVAFASSVVEEVIAEVSDDTY